MNYFTFYGLPLSFFPDQTELRKLYYAKSKEYHPDYYTQASEERQQEIMELSSYNNSAYLTLQDPDKRMQYILSLYGALDEESSARLPAAFLSEMMDINEAIMALEFDFEQALFEQISRDSLQILQQLTDEIQPVLQDFSDQNPTDSLPLIKDFYLKKRYLLRIQENLAKFASL
jgi:molecular chaperone HscB